MSLRATPPANGTCMFYMLFFYFFYRTLLFNYTETEIDANLELLNENS